ncbi:A-type voltage-gated potassium channel KCND3-like [Clytia hemisphaerica]|uniref:BTB domain-containing protein n=1 Tax=Clytia hemisphaerica TaxID=252671 RepID=A0A7M5V457_9CNID
MYSLTTTAGYFVSKKFANLNRTALKNRYIPSRHNAHKGRKLRINVSGSEFRINEAILEAFPETLLGNPLKRGYYYDTVDQEFFFDRDPFLFKFIFKYYKTGKLHYPETECYEAFMDELNFFQINLTEIAPCCREAFAIYLINKVEENVRSPIARNRPAQILISSISNSSANKKKKVQYNHLRKLLWDFAEDPQSSYPALVFYFLSCAIIILSIIVNCVETVNCPTDYCLPVSGNLGANTTCNYSPKCGDLYSSIFFVLDTFCVVYFCIEYLIRLYGAPNRINFIKSKMGLIDLLAIMPYFVDLAIRYYFTGLGAASKYVEMLRSFRIVRIIKLVRHSERLKNLASAITSSISELGFILFMYSIVVIVFASTIFYAEAAGRPPKESVFGSIPEAIWYTVVTTTTLGYGDVVPETIQGKLIGSLCCLMGVIVIALPVPIIQMKSQTLVSGDI